MKNISFIFIFSFILWGCSVFGESGVEIAPYEILKKENKFEIRHYDQIILVTTSIQDGAERRSPFYKLFNYISGENKNNQEISMTAPVFMDQENGKSATMSFVMPANFSLENTPVPLDKALGIEEIQDYTVATITFNGSFDEKNIEKNISVLQKWIADKNLKVTGIPKAAGYNPPFTIPALRRNEILIPIEKP